MCYSLNRIYALFINDTQSSAVIDLCVSVKARSIFSPFSLARTVYSSLDDEWLAATVFFFGTILSCACFFPPVLTQATSQSTIIY